MKLIGTTTSPVQFTINIGQQSRTEMYPVGTVVEIDEYEMESNPNFFHVSIADTDDRIHAYVSFDQVESL